MRGKGSNLICLNIITIVKDDYFAISRTIKSVKNASQPEDMTLRHLICTGNSDENLINHILSISSDLVEIVSKDDSGIYNAMNKGLANVESGWVMFLNGGDTLNSIDSLEIIFNCIKKTNCVFLQLQTATGTKISPQKKYSRLQHYLGRSMHAHPSFLFKYDPHKIIPFDENLKILGDFKFILQNTKKSKIDFKPHVVSVFEGGGISSTNLETLVREANAVRIQLCPNIFLLPFVRLWNLKVRFFSHL